MHVKSYEASNLPPCKAELIKHIDRSAYISNIWMNAYQKVPTKKVAVENGWHEIGGRYEFDWFEGQQLPINVKDVIDGNYVSGNRI